MSRGSTQATPDSDQQPAGGRRKRPFYARWWFWLGLIVVLVVIIVATSSGGGGKTNSATTPVNPSVSPGPVSAAKPPAAAPAPKTATVGDTVAFSDSQGSGTVTVNSVRWLTKGQGPIAQTPKSGTYLVVNVTVAGKSGTVLPNPLAFRMVAPDGTTTQTELGAVDNQIDSNDVTAGRLSRGDVAFDVAKGPAYTLDYSIIGPPLASFAIPAG